MAKSEEIRDFYGKKLEKQQERLRLSSSKWSMVGYLRGGMFLLSLVPIGLGFASFMEMRTPWFWLAGLLFLGFLVVAFFHEGMSTAIRKSRLLCEMHRESLARMDRDWPKIKSPPYEFSEEFTPVAFDLDLFGDSSLFKLLGIARTPLGITTLGDWIVNGADCDEVAARQIAVAELAPKRELREKFRLICAELSASQSGPNRFAEWTESENWFSGRLWLLWLCRLTGLVSIAAIVLMLVGLIPLTITGPVLMVTVAINFFISVFFAGAMHDIFNQISTHQNEITKYGSLFSTIVDFESESPYLHDIKAGLSAGENNVQADVATLSKWNWLANIRRNGVLFIPYLIFEFLVMWDAHVLWQLEKWKEKHGGKAKGWFQSLGKWEAILALSKLAHDNPDWVFPKVTEQGKDQTRIECKKIAHPLMGPSVSNDVSVGPPGSVLLVTGSNMSGKSTLLRSIGVNAVLAQMGSVVRAESMESTPLHIETSMRIVDSLADGVSFFMAELKRLKYVVDQASSHQSAGQRPMLFLLDEILQGTNSRERQIAVSRVVRSLIDRLAIGAISTHDLDLATTPELEKACRTVHFSEQFTEEDGVKKMTFDYKMKQGIAETTNALKLLEIVGLTEPE